MITPLENGQDEESSNNNINLPQPVKILNKTIHECDVCSKQFCRRDHLTKHKFIHLKSRPFSCEVCLKTFARDDQMKKHLKTHWIDDSNENELISGKTEIKTHTCTVCSKKFSRKDIMKKHLFTHSGIKPFSCEVCFKAFGRRDHMEKHSRTHIKDRSLSDSLFEIMSYQQMSNDAEQNNVEDLYQTHANFLSEADVSKKSSNIFNCTICSKQFLRKDILKKHVFIHSGIKPFSCEICFKAFGRKDYLKKHMLTHSKERRNESVAESRVNVSEDVKFEAEEENLIESRFHTNGMLPMDSKVIIKSDNIFQCSLCPKEFFRRDHYKKHMHIHSGIKPFSCEICLKAFGRRDYLKKHLLTHVKEKRVTESTAKSENQRRLMDENECNEDDSSVDDKLSVAELVSKRRHLQDGWFQVEENLTKTGTFQCTLCSKEFSRKDVLKKHLFTHSDIKPFSCEICSKAFGRRDYLKKHSLSHTRERKSPSDPVSGEKITKEWKFECSLKNDNGLECGKCFTSRWSLQKHIKTHSNFELYKCAICSKRFSKKSSLVKHLHKHFPSNKDVLKCDICSKEFSRKDRLKRHMNIHSDVRPFSCMVCLKTFRRKHHMQRHLERHDAIKTECD